MERTARWTWPAVVLCAPAAAAGSAAAQGETPRELAVGGEGVFRPGLNLQGWFLTQINDEDETDVDADITETFRLRRAQIFARGRIVEDLVSYSVMIDPARVLEFREFPVLPADPDNPGETVVVRQPPDGGAVAMLQDVFITFHLPYVDVSLGQFKIPVSWEGYNSTSRLLFPEQATVVRTYGGSRDMGIRLEKKFDRFGYSAGIFSGEGANALDSNDQKDLTLRLETYPVPGMTIAGVAWVAVGERDAAGTKDRFEVDVRWEHGPFLFQSEYINARDVNDAGRTIEAHGFYAALAWTFLDVLQPCVRAGHYNPDIYVDGTTPKTDESWEFNVGLNYYIRRHDAKLQLSYSRFQFDDLTPRNEIILAAQVAY
ncbi:MAG: porin [Myxococcota bacterium]|nr:porin [Myxococcota bacterium]